MLNKRMNKLNMNVSKSQMDTHRLFNQIFKPYNYIVLFEGYEIFKIIYGNHILIYDKMFSRFKR